MLVECLLDIWTLSNIFIVGCILYTYQYTLCIVAIVGCILYMYQYMLCIVAIVGCLLYTYQYTLCIVAIVGLYTIHISIHIMYCCYCWLYSSMHPYMVIYSFLRRLGNIALENTTADILIEDQLWPPLVMVTVHLGVWTVQTKLRNCAWAICLGTNRPPKLCLCDAYTFSIFIFDSLVEKRSSCGCWLKDLESSGTKVMIRGPIVC